MKKIFLSLLLSFLLLPLSVLNGSDALKALDKLDYANAIQAYQKEFHNRDLPYEVAFNMGNAYFRLGDFGRAIFYYKHAERLAPRDEDIKLNLALAEEKAVDKIEDKSSFLKRTLVLSQLLSEREQWIALLSLIFILFITATVNLYKRHYLTRNLFLVTFGATLLLGILILKENLFQPRLAVVVRDQAEIRSSPLGDGIVLFTLNRGAELDVLERYNKSNKVQLKDGKRGWISDDSIIQ